MYLNHEIPELHTGFLPLGQTRDSSHFESDSTAQSLSSGESRKQLALDTVLTANDLQRLLRILTAQS